MTGEHFSYSPQQSDGGVPFQNSITILPANVPQDGVDSVNSVRNQDTFIDVCANEPCGPLATGIQESWVFQLHKLVRVALILSVMALQA